MVLPHTRPSSTRSAFPLCCGQDDARSRIGEPPMVSLPRPKIDGQDTLVSHNVTNVLIPSLLLQSIPSNLRTFIGELPATLSGGTDDFPLTVAATISDLLVRWSECTSL